MADFEIEPAEIWIVQAMLDNRIQSPELTPQPYDYEVEGWVPVPQAGYVYLDSSSYGLPWGMIALGYVLIQ